MAQVEVAALAKTFRHRRGAVAALQHVDLVVPAGSLTVLLGASGSGKSTLLRCVAGLERPDGGRITIGDRTVWDATRRTDVAPDKRGIGMVFQSYALWPHMTVRENVAYPLRVQGLHGDLRGSRVNEVLTLVGCGHLGDRYPAALSGGQQQRVALARALAFRPSVLLFDEPLSNVDALQRRELREHLKRLHAEIAFTGIYVTHDQSEALYLGTRVAVMRDGVIEQIGTPEEVHRYPATEPLAQFLGARNSIVLGEARHRGLLEQLRRYSGIRLGDGSQARAYVRSEHIRLTRTLDAAGRAVLGEGTIQSVSYAGEWMEYEVELGPDLIHVLSAEAVAGMSERDRVWATTELVNVLVYFDGRLVFPN